MLAIAAVESLFHRVTSRRRHRLLSRVCSARNTTAATRRCIAYSQSPNSSQKYTKRERCRHTDTQTDRELQDTSAEKPTYAVFTSAAAMRAQPKNNMFIFSQACTILQPITMQEPVWALLKSWLWRIYGICKRTYVF